MTEQNGITLLAYKINLERQGFNFHKESRTSWSGRSGYSNFSNLIGTFMQNKITSWKKCYSQLKVIQIHPEVVFKIIQG